MQLFFIALAGVTGSLLLISIVYGTITLEVEMARNRPLKTPERAIVEKLPPARLTRSEYNRLIRAEKKTRLVRAGSRVF